MSLTTTAFLEIDDGAGSTGTFEFAIGLEETTEIEKQFIMSNRGQFIQEVTDNTVADLDVNAVAERRAGWWLDGGAGMISSTISFRTGLEDVTWGDQDGGTGPGNVTKTDASGADVPPLDRKQVLEYWIQRTRTDSFGQARFHWGQWTDGSLGGVSAGVYGQPMLVAIQSSTIDTPDPDGEVGNLTGSLVLARVDFFPDDSLPSKIVDAADKIQEMISGTQDT